MGEILYQKFLDEQVENLQEVLLHHGINGILYEFEMWLDRNGRLKDVDGG